MKNANYCDKVHLSTFIYGTVCWVVYAAAYLLAYVIFVIAFGTFHLVKSLFILLYCYWLVIHGEDIGAYKLFDLFFNWDLVVDKHLRFKKKKGGGKCGD